MFILIFLQFRTISKIANFMFILLFMQFTTPFLNKILLLGRIHTIGGGGQILKLWPYMTSYKYSPDEWYWAMSKPTPTWPNFNFGRLFMRMEATNDKIGFPMV